MAETIEGGRGMTGAPLAAIGSAPRMSELFSAAFMHSKNAMALVDDSRRLVDVNGAFVKLLGYRRVDLIGRPMFELVVGRPLATPQQWRRSLAEGHFSGQARLHCADADIVAVQWAATTEVVSGRRLVLFVALNTSRWGERFRRTVSPDRCGGTLSAREIEIVRLVSLGDTGPEIAEQLGIAHQTVRTHVRNSMDKLGARSRAHLVARALGDGLVLG